MSRIPEQDVSAQPVLADPTRATWRAEAPQRLEPPQRPEPPQRAGEPVDLAEAARQLRLAAHDIAVASTCLGLGDLNEAHTNAITARAAADAAEEILRIAVDSAASGGQLE